MNKHVKNVLIIIIIAVVLLGLIHLTMSWLIPMVNNLHHGVGM